MKTERLYFVCAKCDYNTRDLWHLIWHAFSIHRAKITPADRRAS